MELTFQNVQFREIVGPSHGGQYCICTTYSSSIVFELCLLLLVHLSISKAEQGRRRGITKSIIKICTYPYTGLQL
jgi:hypothetical protein